MSLSRSSLALCVAACVSGAASAQTAAEADASSSSSWRYSVGVRFLLQDRPDGQSSTKLKPMLGIGYGRWKLGSMVSDDWLSFNSFRKEPSISYDFLQSRKIRLGVSLRIHNLSSQDDWDGFSGGRKTIRGRVQVTYLLDDQWAIGTEFTTDLRNRGDGQTISLGPSYTMRLDERSRLSFNGGVTWGSAEHWRTAAGSLVPPDAPLGSGLGAVGIGSSYRHLISPRLSWFASIGKSWAVGNYADYTSSSGIKAQVGLRYHDQLGW